MTLVLTLATRDVVVQASDRRFVYFLPDGTAKVRDDNANKAVVFVSRIAYSFTGLAEMGPMRQRTDEWIAHALAGAPGQAEAMAALALKANERFQKPAIRRLPDSLKLHEFVGGGWARFPDGDGRMEPYVAAVSNFRGSSRERLPLQEEFLSVTFRIDAAQDALFVDAGYELSTGERKATWDRLSIAARSTNPVHAFIEVLIDTIRDVADREDTVGHGVLVTCMPRRAAEREREFNLLLAGEPVEDENTFLYVNEGDNVLVQYGPIVVTAGGGIMAGFEAHSLPPAGPANLEAGLPEAPHSQL